jgi:hydroxyethylthiazole kinase-like uncharacterized protein yjeF
MKTVTTAQMRALDERTIAAGTPAETLMERAGEAVARATARLLVRYQGRAVLIFAGKGNNGGDALVAARHLKQAGFDPTLVSLAENAPPRDELEKIARKISPAVVVDGLLGTGLSGDVRSPYTETIDFINDLGRPVVAIDVPSGLDGDTGQPHGNCVRATVTVTMGLPKIGLLQPDATDFVGKIEVADIGIPEKFIEEIASDVELLVASDMRGLFGPRKRSAHKGDFGHLLVIAGHEGYTGAAILCATAAMRAGAGLVTLGVPRNIYHVIAAMSPPELMPRPYDSAKDILAALPRFDALAIGPGISQRPDMQELARSVISEAEVPMVVDADALNAVAKHPHILKKLKAPTVVTPHPGEMSRLTGMKADEIQARRWEIARNFAQEFPAVCVLKGAGTVIAQRDGPIFVNSTGNPGLAKGGTGDVLTGIIGSLLAQNYSLFDAARAGVFVHGLAADLAVEKVSERALLASDVLEHIGAAFDAVQNFS